jgi:inward rectifier potassium channel
MRRHRRSPAALQPVIRLGTPRWGWRDLYHTFLVQPWSVFLVALLGLYLLTNLVFAILFALVPGAVHGVRGGSLLDAFFFSLETLSTVGYGEMYPQTLYGHAIVSLEIVVGVLVIPLATGLIIAKATLPTARVMFSRYMVVNSFQGQPTLMFRVANIRPNQIIEARMKLVMLRSEETEEGHRFRRMHDLALMRDTSPFFALSWTVMHRIDESSPFFGTGPDECRAESVQLIAVLTGLDGTTSTTVYARHVYAPDDILFGQQFEDVLEVSEDGTVKIDYRRFHDTNPAVG